MAKDYFIVTVDDGAKKEDYLMTHLEAQRTADLFELSGGGYEISITHPDALEVKTAEQVFGMWEEGKALPLLDAEGFGWCSECGEQYEEKGADGFAVCHCDERDDNR